MIQDRVGSANIRVTLTDAQADAALRKVLADGDPGLLGVQEWDGPTPPANDLTARAVTDPRLETVTRVSHRRWARPDHADGPCGPVVYDGSRYGLLTIRGVTIAKAGLMGRLPGRRDGLPASVATLAIFEDEVLGGQAALIDAHLTAEVQHGRGYWADATHAARVRRHKQERAGLRTLARRQLAAGRRVYVVADTNFDGMPLPPLTACWEGHPHAEGTGTLGSRTPDYVYAADDAAAVQIIPTASDHDAVVATYHRQERA